MKRNSDWFKNRNATKNPKLFNVYLERDSKGEFHLLGNMTRMLNRTKGSVDMSNLDTPEWERVNTRALGRLVNKQGLKFA